MERTHTEVQRLSDEEVIAEIDNLAGHVPPQLSYYLEEIRHRHLNRHSETMLNYTETILGYTKWMKWMTLIITVATIINVIVLSAS